MRRWNQTASGLEGYAIQHSDCLFALDELSQLEAKNAGEAVYMLANGDGKGRMNSNVSLRNLGAWRLLFLSSGEDGLKEHMALAGRKPKAGQEIRMLEIPADAGKGGGIFETVSGQKAGEKFSKELEEASTENYGVASIAFINKLVEDSSKIHGYVKNIQKEFTARNLQIDAGAQSGRAALRFGLIAAAGEIATEWGITGWTKGIAIEAADICFKEWLGQRGGSGNAEDRAMLAQVKRFFELHGEARFTDWDRPASDTSQHSPKTINRVGYRRHTDAKDEKGNAIYLNGLDGDGMERKAKNTDYYVFPTTFEEEICNGFDYRVICRLLADKGMLLTEGKSFKRKERLPGGEHPRCYRITSKILGSDDD
jgi:uncharacterized protein (DUF927 family)